jgi:TetR/AcrR family transcriptional repressor of nem operon
MNKQMSKAERTRSFIIESTAEIFNKKGYAGTSMSDLTAATKLTKGSIYGNFENKEEVALAAFDYNYSRISQTIRDLVDKAETYHDKLLVYANVYKKVIRGAVDRGGCPVLNTATEADDTNHLLKEKAAKAVKKWENNLTILIEQGIAIGEFKPEVNIRQTALSIIALIEGGVMISRVTNDRSSMDEVLNTVELLISQMKK